LKMAYYMFQISIIFSKNFYTEKGLFFPKIILLDLRYCPPQMTF